MTANRRQILEKAELARKRIADFHLRVIANSPGDVFLISTAYPGVWMEHAFDALCYASLSPEDPKAVRVAENQMLLFIRNQKPDGHLPAYVLDPELLKQKPAYGRPLGYGQIQECVSFASLCFETWLLSRNTAFLQEAYKACKGWEQWICKNRMTMELELAETFCVFDTGHDNSLRFEGLPGGCPDPEGKTYADLKELPILSPDVNAVLYGNRRALADMANALGKPEEETEWLKKAQALKTRMTELLFDSSDDYFYDVGRDLNKRKIKSISITNVFSEKVLTQEEFDRIYHKHFKDPDEFDAPYPFPSIALCDSRGHAHAEKNCWGYFSQALTALRAQRWMDFYGRSEDYDRLLEKWVDVYALQSETLFTQEIDPFTGIPTDCSRWYSSAMLLYLYAVKRLKLE